MDVKEKRDADKARRARYRELAGKMCPDMVFEKYRIRVNPHGSIQEVDRGAWVEAMIFVPKSEL